MAYTYTSGWLKAFAMSPLGMGAAIQAVKTIGLFLVFDMNIGGVGALAVWPWTDLVSARTEAPPAA